MYNANKQHKRTTLYDILKIQKKHGIRFCDQK